MAGVASLFDMCSSRAEISEDEGSDVSEHLTTKPKPEDIESHSKGKLVNEEPESLMVESDNEDEEDEEDEVGEDEYGSIWCARGLLLRNIAQICC